MLGGMTCCTRCSSTAHHVVAIRAGGRAHESRAQAGEAIHPDSRAVLLQLRRGSPAAGVRLQHRARGRAQGLHDDQPGSAARGDGGDHACAHGADRSRGGGRLDRSAHRRDQGDDGGHARAARQPVQLRHERAASAGSTFKTIALTTAVARGMDPFTHVVSLRAVPLPAGLDVQPERSELRVERADLRPHVSRRRVGRERDSSVGQHGVRPAVARRRSREHRRDGAKARHPHVAAAGGAVARARLRSV